MRLHYNASCIKLPEPAWLNPLILACMVIMFCYVGPSIDTRNADRAHAENLNDALNTEHARLLLARRIALKCGPNAVASELGGGLMQCADKHGRKTIIAQAVP